MALFGPTSEKIEKWAAAGNAKKLFSVLHSNDAVMRRAAIEGLAKVRGPEVFQYCRDNAHHPDQQVRWCVTQILGLIGTPEAMEILGTVLDPTDQMKRNIRKKNV